MRHPGMRGQPADAILIEFTQSTVTIGIFSYVVWSGILQQPVEANACTFSSTSGDDGIPVIRMTLQKVYMDLWGEFISDVGTNSLLE